MYFLFPNISTELTKVEKEEEEGREVPKREVRKLNLDKVFEASNSQVIKQRFICLFVVSRTILQLFADNFSGAKLPY